MKTLAAFRASRPQRAPSWSALAVWVISCNDQIMSRRIDLDRLLAAVVDEEDRRQEHVPVLDDVEEHQRHDHGHGQREHDVPENLQIVGAVNDRRLLHLGGRLAEVADQHDQLKVLMA